MSKRNIDALTRRLGAERDKLRTRLVAVHATIEEYQGLLDTAERASEDLDICIEHLDQAIDSLSELA